MSSRTATLPHLRQQSSLWQTPLQTQLPRIKPQIGDPVAPDSALHEFLRHNEWRHLQLSALFVPQYHAAAKQQKQFTLPSVPVFAHTGPLGPAAAKQQSAPKIELLLLWTEPGRLLFDGTALHDASHLPIKAIKHLLKIHKTRQFIGTHNQYQFLERIYPFHFVRKEYWIMVRKRVSPTEEKAPATGLQIKRLTMVDLAQLQPLEWGYYQEEVIQSPLSASLYHIIEKNCTRRLEQFLQYGIFSGSELIARAMINAYGLYYWQLGGFYTVPRWRGRRLASILLQKLCAVIEGAGRSAMLFVRQDNAAALHLYQKHSFAIADHMVVAQENSIQGSIC